MGRVAGKVALITGGASGIGAASARLLVREGARVAITDINEKLGREVAGEIGDAALFLHHDVTSEPAWRSVTDAVLAHFGDIDIVINSAGLGSLSDIERCTMEEWHRVNTVNMDGVFLGCKYGIDAIKRHGRGGSIINLSSVSGLVGGHNMAAYNASKGGVRLLTKSVALHCARKRYGIRCNSVHPTFILTPMVQAMIDGSDDPERTRQRLERQVPVGRLGQADDVAYMILFLASDESTFVTGAELVVDGGLTAQ